MGEISSEIAGKNDNIRRWTIVAGCIVSQMVALGLTVNCFTLFVSHWRADLNTSVSTLAFSVTLFSMGAALALPLIGIATDRIAARRLFVVAMLGLAGFHFIVGFLNSGWQLNLAYVLILPWAAGLAGAVPCQALVARWFAGRKDLGLALGISAMGMQIGGVLLPRVIIEALPELGWRLVFQIFAGAILFLVLPFLAWAMKEPPAPTDDRISATLSGRTDSSINQILRNRRFWLLIATIFPVQSAAMGMMLNLSPLAADNGFDAALAGSILIVLSITALVTKVVAGMLADRFGDRAPLIGVAAATGIGLLLVAGAQDHAGLFLLGAVLTGLAAGIWPLAASVLSREFGTASFGRAFGLVVTVLTFTSFAPPVFALARETSGSYHGILLAMGVLTIGGALAGLGLAPGKGAPSAPAAHG